MFFRRLNWNVVGWLRTVSIISYAIIVAGLLMMGYNWVTKGYPLQLGPLVHRRHRRDREVRVADDRGANPRRARAARRHRRADQHRRQSRRSVARALHDRDASRLRRPYRQAVERARTASPRSTARSPRSRPSARRSRASTSSTRSRRWSSRSASSSSTSRSASAGTSSSARSWSSRWSATR